MNESSLMSRVLFGYLCSIAPISILSFYFDHLSSSPPPADNSYGYAVDYQDYEGEVTRSKFHCLKASTYELMIIGVFRPIDNGVFDPNAPKMIRMALDAGLRVDVYMHVVYTPNIRGSEQLALLLKSLSDEGIDLKSIWLMATEQTQNESRWPLFNQTASILFLSDIILSAEEKGIQVGIYTNSRDWERIFGKRGATESDAPLWYHNVTNHGIEGETAHNFDDYIPFGPFLKPTLKQFAHREVLCGLNVSRNVYRKDSLLDRNGTENSHRYVVGDNFNMA